VHGCQQLVLGVLHDGDMERASISAPPPSAEPERHLIALEMQTFVQLLKAKGCVLKVMRLR
jgi:hypothetical protein